MIGSRTIVAILGSYLAVAAIFTGIALVFQWDEEGHWWKSAKFGLFMTSSFAFVIGCFAGVVQLWMWAGVR